MATISKISELTPHRNDWTIRVMVLKKWSEMVDGGGDILRFLLVDDYGGKIPAIVGPGTNLYAHFDDVMHENKWKIITGFNVEFSPPGFRFAVNEQTIILTGETDLHNGYGVFRDHYMTSRDTMMS
ncbi:unnamed protein product [Microthlaspi erraticum]|uniref:Replication protein A 70 kDa DNA-binding subunit B/D first OB fold domain-containing protein n=1 Tax=Microthlaspi erraticum TaxID=1685480 RepID=A0A6D2J5K7_9BRAS|nr:unnamed protein product [Microthlaspi erraticum]CAA7032661.1 unnamed protein product [Microthlaspi erraticum]